MGRKAAEVGVSGLRPGKEFAFILHFTAHFTLLDLSSPSISLGPVSFLLFHCYRLRMQPTILLNAFSVKPKMHLGRAHVRYQKTEELQWHGGNVEILSREGISKYAVFRVWYSASLPNNQQPWKLSITSFSNGKLIVKRIPKNYYFNKHFKPCSLKMMYI